MTQYTTLNVKLYNLQRNKLKPGIKKLSSVVAGDSNDWHRLLLIYAQVLRLCKAFANGSSANIKLSKTQLYKIRQSRGFLGRLLGPLLKTDLSLMKNVLKPIAKSVLIPLGLRAAAAATDAAIHIKMFGSGMTTLIISNG